MSWRINKIATEGLTVGDELRIKIELESLYEKDLYQADPTKEYDLVPAKNLKDVKVIYLNTKTNELCIKWNDDTITTAKCSDNDEFDVYVGFALAYTKKVFGSNTKMRKFVDEHYKTSKK